MYKKITHNIVEEHFDHPIASQIKKSMSRSKIPTDEILSEPKFKEDVHSYFETYLKHLKDLVNSVNGTQEDFLLEFENFFKTPWIDDLGNMTKPIYQTEFGEKLNESLRMMATTIFTGLQLIKEGKDFGSVFNRINFITNDLSQTLQTFNNQWAYTTTNPLFNSLFTDLFALAKARVSKNTTLEQQLLQKITASWSAFENVLVNGIIKQHSDRFSKAMAASNASYSNKDIM